MSRGDSLVAFAVIANDFEQSGDISSGISKVFAPILSANTGQLFNPENFRERVKEKLDIVMHPYAVEYFAGVLAKQGYLGNL